MFFNLNVATVDLSDYGIEIGESISAVLISGITYQQSGGTNLVAIGAMNNNSNSGGSKTTFTCHNNYGEPVTIKRAGELRGWKRALLKNITCGVKNTDRERCRSLNLII